MIVQTLAAREQNFRAIPDNVHLLLIDIDGPGAFDAETGVAPLVARGGAL